MKLTYVHTAPVPSLAANAVQVARMCAAFQAAGAAVTLVQPSGAGGTAAEIAAHYGLDAPFAARLVPMPPLPARELIYGALAVLLHGPGRAGVVYSRSVSVGMAAMALRQPFALEMHVPASAFRPRIAARLGRVVASPLFAGMVVISEKLKADYEARYPALRGRILVAHDGAEPAAEVAPAPLKGDFRVGYVGQLYPGKGMEIIAALVPLCPFATFHIVGGAPEDVVRWRAALAGHRNVVFHGHMRHADTPAYLAAMDAVLAPYLRVVRGIGGGERQNLADWMSPLKIFEYMARAKPIVASDLEVLREVLTDGENALLCAPEDIGAWASALARLHGDEIFRRRIGIRGQNDFLAHYTWDKRARAILGALDEGLRRGQDHVA
ncbi:MAG: glycosyltransferase family 4 protein [Parvibaculum sp.]